MKDCHRGVARTAKANVVIPLAHQMYFREDEVLTGSGYAENTAIDAYQKTALVARTDHLAIFRTELKDMLLNRKRSVYLKKPIKRLYSNKHPNYVSPSRRVDPHYGFHWVSITHNFL
jgi:hypothetical protein